MTKPNDVAPGEGLAPNVMVKEPYDAEAAAKDEPDFVVYEDGKPVWMLTARSRAGSRP